MGIRRRVLVILSIAGGIALIASVVFAQLGSDNVPVPENPIAALDCDSGVTHDFFEVVPSSITTHNDTPVEAVANYLRTAPSFEDASEHAQEFRPVPEDDPVGTPSPSETVGERNMNPAAYLYPTVMMVHLTDSRVDSVIEVQDFESRWATISATTCDGLIAKWRDE